MIVAATVAGANALPSAAYAEEKPVQEAYSKWHAMNGAALRVEAAALFPLISPVCPLSEAMDLVGYRYAEFLNSLTLPRQKLDLEIAQSDYAYAAMARSGGSGGDAANPPSFVGSGCPKPGSPEALEQDKRDVAAANQILDRMEILVAEAPKSSAANPQNIPAREWRGDDDFYSVWVTYGRAEVAYARFRNRHCAFDDMKQRSLSHVLKETRERLDSAKQRLDILWPGGSENAPDLFSDDAAVQVKFCDDEIAANEAFGAALGTRDALEFMLEFKERERLSTKES